MIRRPPRSTLFFRLNIVIFKFYQIHIGTKHSYIVYFLFKEKTFAANLDITFFCVVVYKNFTPLHTKLHTTSHETSLHFTQNFTLLHTKLHSTSHKTSLYFTQNFTLLHTKLHSTSHRTSLTSPFTFLRKSTIIT